MWMKNVDDDATKTIYVRPNDVIMFYPNKETINELWNKQLLCIFEPMLAKRTKLRNRRPITTSIAIKPATFDDHQMV